MPDKRLLSSIIINRNLSEALSLGIEESLFEKDLSRKVFVFIVEYVRKYNKVPTKKTVYGNFEDFKILQTEETVEEAAGNFLIKAKSKKFKQTMKRIAKLHDANHKDQAYEELVEAAVRISSMGSPMGNMAKYSDLDKRITEYLNDVKNKSANLIHYGFRTLDNLTGGMSGGDLIIILGPYEGGKSTFMRKILLNALQEGNNVLTFSQEESHKSFIDKTYCIDAGISYIKFKNKKLKSKQLKKLNEVYKRSKKDYGEMVVISGERKLTVGSIISRLERHKPDLLAIDGVYRATGMEWTDVSAFISELKNIAIWRNIPIIGIGQTNRRGIEQGKTGKENVSYMSYATESDILLATAPDDELRMEKLLPIEWIKHRDSGNRTNFIIKFDVEKGQIYEP